MVKRLLAVLAVLGVVLFGAWEGPSPARATTSQQYPGFKGSGAGWITIWSGFFDPGTSASGWATLTFGTSPDGSKPRVGWQCSGESALYVEPQIRVWQDYVNLSADWAANRNCQFFVYYKGTTAVVDSTVTVWYPDGWIAPSPSWASSTVNPSELPSASVTPNPSASSSWSPQPTYCFASIDPSYYGPPAPVECPSASPGPFAGSDLSSHVASITPYSEYPGWGAMNQVDGNLSTAWASNDGTVNLSSLYTFDTDVTLTGLVLVQSDAYKATGYEVKDWVEYGASPIWDTANAAEDVTVTGVGSTSTVNTTLTGSSIRNLRIKVTGEASTGWHIFEATFYGYVGAAPSASASGEASGGTSYGGAVCAVNAQTGFLVCSPGDSTTGGTSGSGSGIGTAGGLGWNLGECGSVWDGVPGFSWLGCVVEHVVASAVNRGIGLLRDLLTGLFVPRYFFGPAGLQNSLASAAASLGGKVPFVYAAAAASAVDVFVAAPASSQEPQADLVLPAWAGGTVALPWDTMSGWLAPWRPFFLGLVGLAFIVQLARLVGSLVGAGGPVEGSDKS